MVGSHVVFKCLSTANLAWNIHNFETTIPPGTIETKEKNLIIKRVEFVHQNLIYWCDGLDFFGKYIVGVGKLKVMGILISHFNLVHVITL